jgi:hypothetical protein
MLPDKIYISSPFVPLGMKAQLARIVTNNIGYEYDQ